MPAVAKVRDETRQTSTWGCALWWSFQVQLSYGRNLSGDLFWNCITGLCYAMRFCSMGPACGIADGFNEDQMMLSSGQLTTTNTQALTKVCSAVHTTPLLARPKMEKI